MDQEKTYMQKISEAAAHIASLGGEKPMLGAVLGSGLGASSFPFAQNIRKIPYADIPHAPRPSVQGHSGTLVLLEAGGAPCAILAGRVHLYEGWDAHMVTFAVRVLLKLGCRTFLLTNAAGAVNPKLRPGSLVLLTDHINLTGEDPTRGKVELEWGERFTGLVDLYDPGCRAMLKRAGDEENITLHEGVYAALKGPSYETPAEIKMLATLGADLVGMSTVPEAIAARHGGARVAAISCVTNLGAGIEGSNPNHEEVKEIAAQASQKLVTLFGKFAGYLKNELKGEDG